MNAFDAYTTQTYNAGSTPSSAQQWGPGNSCPVVPQPQPVGQGTAGNGSYQLMATRWGEGSYTGNFGGLNLCSVQKKVTLNIESAAKNHDTQGKNQHVNDSAVQNMQEGGQSASDSSVKKDAAINAHAHVRSRQNHCQYIDQNSACLSNFGQQSNFRVGTNALDNHQDCIKHISVRHATGDEIHNRYGALSDDQGNVESDILEKPRGATLGDCIARAAASRSISRCCRRGVQNKRKNDHGKGHSEGKVMCLTAEPRPFDIGSGLDTCAAGQDEEYDMSSVMNDAGASETVASIDRFADYPLIQTTAFGTTSPTAASTSVDITNVWEKYIQVVSSNGVESMARFQMCKCLGRDKVLASVSRLSQSGHKVAFQTPEYDERVQGVPQAA